MLPPNLKLTHADDVPYTLRLAQADSPYADTGVNTVHAFRDDADNSPILTLTGELPSDYELAVYGGKGGHCALLNLPNGLTCFMFPGATAKVGDCHIELAGQTLKSEAAGKACFTRHWEQPDADKPQTITQQAMVLGAGIGTRILPLTEQFTAMAKPALPLDGHHTVMGRIVYQLSLHGIKHLYVNTFFERESVGKALDDACKATGLQWHEIPESRATGTAGGLNHLTNHPHDYPDFDPTQPMLIVQGDAVTTDNFSQLLEAHQAHAALVTIGCQLVGEEDVNKFGIMATESADGNPNGGAIVEFLEKPTLAEAGPHRLANTGFYVLAPKVYELANTLYLRKLAEEQVARGSDVTEVKEFDFAKDLFPYLLNEVQHEPCSLWAEEVDGHWCDIGNPTQYLQTLQALYAGWLSTPWPVEVDKTQYDPAGVFFWPGTYERFSQYPVQFAGGVVVAQRARQTVSASR